MHHKQNIKPIKKPTRMYLLLALLVQGGDGKELNNLFRLCSRDFLKHFFFFGEKFTRGKVAETLLCSHQILFCFVFFPSSHTASKIFTTSPLITR